MVTLVTTYIAPKTKIGLPYLNQLGLFHSSLRTKDDQTERYLAALRNPHLQIHGKSSSSNWDWLQPRRQKFLRSVS